MHTIDIQQALLGYDRGHRLLACSSVVSSTSKHYLLQFSDRSIAVGKIPRSGYLTGYPLPDDGLYVLAKTWAAPEISRPGCIWTHSLFISFTELAQIGDPRALLQLFVRPKMSEEWDSYAAPLVLDLMQRGNWPSINVDLARELLMRLYSEPNARVFVRARNQASTDVTLLAIWGQQWPRLRRNFRFCSLTAEDRSTEEHKFDVQFIASTQYETHSGNNKEMNSWDKWIDLCVDDLLIPNLSFRDFVWRAGGDISGGRNRFAELCRLFAERMQTDEISGVEHTLAYVVHRLPPEEGRLLRSSAVKDAVKLGEKLGQNSLMEILPYLDEYLKYMEEGLGGVLARRYWELDPEVVVGVDAPECLRTESDELIKALAQEEVIDSVRRGGVVAKVVFARRVDILENSEIWSSEISELAVATLSRVTDGNRQRAVVSALVSASRVDLVDTVCELFGPDNVLSSTIFPQLGEIEAARLFSERAFSLLEDKVVFVETILRTEKGHLDKHLIYLFSQHVSPKIPKVGSNLDVDSWVTIWNDGIGELEPNKTDRVMIFFLMRAIAESSAHAASLLAVSFDRLLDRYSSARLNYESRARVMEHLVLSDWFDWTFESRLTRTVANAVLMHKFAASQLQAVSKKRDRLSRIVRAIAEFEGGKDYLKEIGIKK